MIVGSWCLTDTAEFVEGVCPGDDENWVPLKPLNSPSLPGAWIFATKVLL